MTADPVQMFCPRPDVGLGRVWHVLERQLSGFMLVAPFPCGFVQAEVTEAIVAGALAFAATHPDAPRAVREAVTA